MGVKFEAIERHFGSHRIWLSRRDLAAHCRSTLLKIVSILQFWLHWIHLRREKRGARAEKRLLVCSRFCSGA